MPNGCGMFGTISRVWKSATGRLPPFELCCIEHDLAYEQEGLTETGRAWADAHFKRCMSANGWPLLGAFFYGVVRYFGWVAVLRRSVA